MNHIELKRERKRSRGTIAATTRRLRPTVLALEGRALLSTLTVNNTNDSGAGSLREAVDQANHDGGGDTIVFSSLFNSPQTITLSSGQLELTGTKARTTITGPGANLLTISGHQASRVFEVDANVTASISGLTITGGQAGSGGGLYNDGSNLSLYEVTVTDNIAQYGAGLFNKGKSLTLTGCTVSGNYASGNNASGGGLDTISGTSTLTGCAVSGNYDVGYDDSGGGVANVNSGTTKLYECTISKNFVLGHNNTGNAGGLYNRGGSLSLTDCTVSHNSADYGGGLKSHGGTLSLADCTVNGNSAKTNGGGFYTDDQTVPSLTNCTVTGNTAGNNGGGLFAGWGATLTNCTVSGNSADYYGGVYSPGTVSLTNTIVAGNTGGDINGNPSGSNYLIGGDPLLAPLGDYGGPTLTMALLPGSPAIGGGTADGAPTKDQRGQPRSGPVDIGAIQSQGFTLTPVPGSTPQSTAVGTAFKNPLAVTVKANNPVEPVNDGVVSFVANPSSGGASAKLSSATATISGGQAMVNATANAIPAPYNVTASASGAGATSFHLSNIKTPGVTGTPPPIVVRVTDSLAGLRKAIAYANSHPGPDTIILDPPALRPRSPTFRLTGGPLVLTDPATTTIIGPGARRLTLSGGGKNRVFEIEGGSLDLSGVTITGGSAVRGGGIWNDDGTLSLTDVVIRGNRARMGGGLYNDGRTTFSRVLIEGNRATVGLDVFNTRAATLLWQRSRAK
jgi:predicted outer membrane repeat protein